MFKSNAGLLGDIGKAKLIRLASDLRRRNGNYQDDERCK